MTDTQLPPQSEQRTPSRPPENNSPRTGTSAGILATLFVLVIASIYLATKVHNQSASLADVSSQLNQANSRATQAQADLGAAKAQSAAVQAQIVSDQGKRADLQSQLDQAKAQSSSLDAQLTKDQASRADLQSQLDQAKARSTALQAQLDSAASQSSDYRNQLDQARSLAAGEHAQLAKAQADLAQVHPLVVQMHQLPLTTSFEKSFWDQAFMLHISNSGPASLSLRITVAGANGTRAQQAVIESGATLSIPRLPAGVNVVIASEGFDPLNLTAR